MSGRRLVSGFLVLLAVFTAALVYFQFFAYYHRDRSSAVLSFGAYRFPVEGLDLIDAETSPLKLRACFRTDPGAFAAAPVAAHATPLTPPPWFGCFETGALAADIAAGRATARLLAADEPAGTETIVAIYPDGRGFLWRQLGPDYAE